MIAIILGGGTGTRLFPLTKDRSKPAVPIAGKYRLVDIPISNCLNSGLQKIFVLTQYNSASLNRHIKDTYYFGPFTKGFVDILAAEQTAENREWFQGTADAVRQSLKHVYNTVIDFEHVLILSGDQLYQMDFIKMLESHIENKADISIATIPVVKKDAVDFGILKMNEDKRVVSFIEKPKLDMLNNWISPTSETMQQQQRHYLASMGIYIFSKHVLHSLLFDVNKMATDFGKEIIPYSIKEHNVFSYQYEGYWTDIGNIASFYEANLSLNETVPHFNLFDEVHPIYSRTHMLPPAKISGTLINKSLVTEGSIINASKIENCIIGIRSRIGHDTTMLNTYVMGNDFYESLQEMQESQSKNVPRLGIGDRCFISNTIIDKNCHIGNDVSINGVHHLPNREHSLYSIKEGIVVIKKGVHIPNGFVL